MEPPSFIAAVATYRRERGVTYKEAMRLAFKIFRDKGWPIPQSMQGLEKKYK